MILSELIVELTALLIEHGDVRVVFATDNSPDSHTDPVDFNFVDDATDASCGEVCAIVWHS